MTDMKPEVVVLKTYLNVPENVVFHQNVHIVTGGCCIFIFRIFS